MMRVLVPLTCLAKKMVQWMAEVNSILRLVIQMVKSWVLASAPLMDPYWEHLLEPLMEVLMALK